MSLASYSEAQKNVANRQIDELDRYIANLRREYQRQENGGIVILSDFSGASSEGLPA